MARRLFTDLPAWNVLFDQIPVAAIGTDAAGIVVSWNTHATRLFGWQASETVGRHIRDYAFGHDAIGFGEQAAARVKAGEIWDGESPVQRRDGSRFRIRMLIAPLSDEAADVVGALGLAIDVTELLKLERHETLRTLARAVDQIASLLEAYPTLSIPGREFTQLTARQREIVTLLRQGHRVSTIGDRLGVSESTVRNHLNAAYRRLDVHSQRELIERLYPPS